MFGFEIALNAAAIFLIPLITSKRWEKRVEKRVIASLRSKAGQTILKSIVEDTEREIDSSIRVMKNDTHKKIEQMERTIFLNFTTELTHFSAEIQDRMDEISFPEMPDIPGIPPDFAQQIADKLEAVAMDKLTLKIAQVLGGVTGQDKKLKKQVDAAFLLDLIDSTPLGMIIDQMLPNIKAKIAKDPRAAYVVIQQFFPQLLKDSMAKINQSLINYQKPGSHGGVALGKDGNLPLLQRAPLQQEGVQRMQGEEPETEMDQKWGQTVGPG